LFGNIFLDSLPLSILLPFLEPESLEEHWLGKKEKDISAKGNR